MASSQNPDTITGSLEPVTDDRSDFQDDFDESVYTSVESYREDDDYPDDIEIVDFDGSVYTSVESLPEDDDYPDDIEITDFDGQVYTLAQMEEASDRSMAAEPIDWDSDDYPF
jgi:hypothetical protein